MNPLLFLLLMLSDPCMMLSLDNAMIDQIICHIDLFTYSILFYMCYISSKFGHFEFKLYHIEVTLKI